MCLSPLRKVNETATPFRPNFKPATKRGLVHVLYPLFQGLRTYVTTEPSDCATTTSVYKVNITIDYPVNEMKKTLARHIACGVAELSKLRCNGCEIDHPSQLQHDCLLPDILIDMHFDEAVEKVNSLLSPQPRQSASRL